MKSTKIMVKIKRAIVYSDSSGALVDIWFDNGDVATMSGKWSGRGAAEMTKFTYNDEPHDQGDTEVPRA